MSMAKPSSDSRRTTWGAEPLDGGEARFSVWAPGQESLSLRLDGRDHAMERDAEGWFTLQTRAGAGAAYNFVLPDGRLVPDPASRGQEGDVHGPSLLTARNAYRWQNDAWAGRPWEEAVVYELHVGTFTPEGTFRAAADRLPHLKELGVTAVEIMPVAQFGGNRGWGYDGVLPYAPHRAYGTPDDLRALVDAAHGHGLMVLLDVVYNHFGPDGNYLPLLASAFFDENRHTPWGAAIAFEKEPVRRFFVENALYWLREFRFDGLRLDAVDHLHDPSDPEILVEIARRIRAEFPDRPIHLTTEDNRNITRLHERDKKGLATLHTAEWNDDFHNVAHVIATGETVSYYEDFAEEPLRHFARALAEGFAYQGEPSKHAEGKPRGHPSAHLPPQAFVDFLQNHDQVGNRALGERLILMTDEATLRVLVAILLLSPHIPLLFMGEEWGETRPFLFFTDFHGDLAQAVREGRRREFAKFPAFDTEAERRQIPDPNLEQTFQLSKIDWTRPDSPEGGKWRAFTKELLALRHAHVVPLLHGAGGHSGRVLKAENGALAVDWRLNGGLLQLRATFKDGFGTAPPYEGDVIFSDGGHEAGAQAGDNSPSVLWALASPPGDNQAS
ncbi:MAG TPA: malto-oligosyltrehalose trehalohydrolase [Mesorhizobium sp.]|jgi:malto-oligosyltrehalose trehalohydrolase|nr:malto-oligosyltrehalose trehalohydrolase [Mesorhizobium sp.]